MIVADRGTGTDQLARRRPRESRKAQPLAYAAIAAALSADRSKHTEAIGFAASRLKEMGVQVRSTCMSWIVT